MFILTWLLTLCALWGTWLNARQIREGFMWWIITDVGFAIVNFMIAQYALALLFFVYTLLAIKGLNTWKN